MEGAPSTKQFFMKKGHHSRTECRFTYPRAQKNATV